MTSFEAKEKIEEALLNLTRGIPCGEDGRPKLFSKHRTYYTDSSLNESEAEPAGRGFTLWGEICFSPDCNAFSEKKNTLMYYVSLDVRGGRAIGNTAALDTELRELADSIEAELLTPLSAADCDEDILRIMRQKAELDYKRNIEKFDGELKGFWGKMLIISLIALAAVIPLTILLMKYVFGLW